MAYAGEKNDLQCGKLSNSNRTEQPGGHQHVLKYSLKPRAVQFHFCASNENQTKIYQRFHCFPGPVQVVCKQNLSSTLKLKEV